MSTEQGSSVPDGLLHAYIGCLKPPTPSIGQPSPVDGSTTPSQHVWSSDFLRRRSDGLKLASTLTPWPCLVYWNWCAIQIDYNTTTILCASICQLYGMMWYRNAYALIEWLIEWLFAVQLHITSVALPALVRVSIWTCQVRYAMYYTALAAA